MRAILATEAAHGGRPEVGRFIDSLRERFEAA